MRKTKGLESIKRLPAESSFPANPFEYAGEESKQIVHDLLKNGIDPARARAILLENYFAGVAIEEHFRIEGLPLRGMKHISAAYAKAIATLEGLLTPDLDVKRRRRIEQDILGLKESVGSLTRLGAREGLPMSISEMLGIQAYRFRLYCNQFVPVNTQARQKSLNAMIAEIFNGVYLGNFSPQDIKRLADDVFYRGKV